MPETPEQKAARLERLKATRRTGLQDALDGIGAFIRPNVGSTEPPAKSGRPPKTDCYGDLVDIASRSSAGSGNKYAHDVESFFREDLGTFSGSTRKRRGETSAADRRRKFDCSLKTLHARAREIDELIETFEANQSVDCDGDLLALYVYFNKKVATTFNIPYVMSSPTENSVKYGRNLLKTVDGTTLYEMIHLLMQDWGLILKNRVFLAYGGTPTPTFAVLTANVETLKSYIGVGVKASFDTISPYAQGYAERKGACKEISSAAAKPKYWNDGPSITDVVSANKSLPNSKGTDITPVVPPNTTEPAPVVEDKKPATPEERLKSKGIQIDW